jgi:hypothetical protein
MRPTHPWDHRNTVLKINEVLLRVEVVVKVNVVIQSAVLARQIRYILEAGFVQYFIE